jgi:hypothetical protein
LEGVGSEELYTVGKNSGSAYMQWAIILRDLEVNASQLYLRGLSRQTLPEDFTPYFIVQYLATCNEREFTNICIFLLTSKNRFFLEKTTLVQKVKKLDKF